MKKIFCLISLLWLCLTGSAADLAGMGRQAEQLYAGGKYAEAADLYGQIIAAGKESVKLYYNLGNCCFKMGENTRAIINYERALLLDPGDGMSRYNLDMARQAIVDKINVLPEFFLVRWYKGLMSQFSADGWAYISTGLFLLFLAAVLFFLYSSSMVVKKAGFFSGILALVILSFTLHAASRQNSLVTDRDYAVITAPSVTVKGAPDQSGTSLFLIHEGLKVKITEELGEWYNIRLADGNEGWIAKSDLEKI